MNYLYEFKIFWNGILYSHLPGVGYKNIYNQKKRQVIKNFHIWNHFKLYDSETMYPDYYYKEIVNFPINYKFINN